MRKGLLVALGLGVVVAAWWFLGAPRQPGNVGASPTPDLLRIGVLTDLTSYTAEYGRQERIGLEILAESMNAKAANGRRVVVDVQDTKGTAKDGLNGLRALLATDPKPALLFAALSSVSMAVLPVSRQEHLLVLCNATSPKVLDGSPYSIRNFPDPSQEVAVTLKQAAMPLAVRRLALAYINDEYGNSMLQELSRGLTAANATQLVYSESYDFSTADFKPLVAKLRTQAPDAVYCVGYGSQVGSLFRQLREGGFRGYIFVPSLIVNTESVYSAAAEVAEGIVFNGFEYATGDPALQNFRAAFKSRYPGRQSDIGVLAYVGARLVLEATAGTDGSPDAILASLRRKATFQTLLGTVRFENRNFIYPMKAYIVAAGNVVPFQPPLAKQK